MNIFGEFKFVNEKAREEFTRNLSEIRSNDFILAPAPAATRSYSTSGKMDAGTLPRVLVCMLGALPGGFVIAVLFTLLAIGIFKLLSAIGLLFLIAYLPAILIYYFSPVIIGTMVGYIIGNGSKWARNRNFTFAAIFSILGGIGAACFSWFWYSPWLNEHTIKYWNFTGSATGSFLNPLMMYGTVGTVTSALVAVANLLVPFFVMRGFFYEEKFCESCNTYLDKLSVARLDLGQTKNLLLGLMEGDEQKLEGCSRMMEREKWADKDLRQEVVVTGCTCGATNFVDVTCFYLKGKNDDRSRLVFSQYFSKPQVDKLMAFPFLKS